MINKSAYDFIIGIDSGTNTGFALWDRGFKKLLMVESMMIHQAWEKVINMHTLFDCSKLLIRVEDARLAVHGRNNQVDANKAQGAGSIKRDAAIWEDFLKDKGFHYEMVRPNSKITKLNSELFKKVTGWIGSTNNHARDAAMLCFGY